MEVLEINKEKIEKLMTLCKELREVQENTSTELANAKSNNHRRILYKGKNFEEQVLWDEIRYAGVNGEAGKVMRAKYPKAFDLYDKQEEKSKEYEKFVIDNIGVDPLAMTLADVVQLILGVVDYKLKEKPLYEANEKGEIKKVE